MPRRICPSCGGDTSAVPVKKRQFAEFLMKVVRCPHCGLRNTVLLARPLPRRIRVVFRAVAAKPANRTTWDDSGDDLKIRAEKARHETRALKEELKVAVAQLRHIKEKLPKVEKSYACGHAQSR